MGKQRRPHPAVRKRVAAQIETRLAAVAELLVSVDYELEQLQRLAMENGLDLTARDLERAMERLGAHDRMEFLLEVHDRDLLTDREKREQQAELREMFRKRPELAEVAAALRRTLGSQ